MALTERQQEIKGLLKQGKSADQIGKSLGISTNAVYQQIRRMRQAGEKVGTQRATGARTAAKKSGRKSTSKGKPKLENSTHAPALQPQALSVGRIRPATPLQSVRNRRDEITAETKLALAEVTAAEKALEAAKAGHAKVEARHRDELKALDRAEAVLRPQPAAKPAAAKAAPKKASGKKASTPAKAPSAPPAAPPAPIAPVSPSGTNGTGSAPESAPPESAPDPAPAAA